MGGTRKHGQHVGLVEGEEEGHLSWVLLIVGELTSGTTMWRSLVTLVRVIWGDWHI